MRTYWSLEVQHEISEDLKKRIVALHKHGVGYKKIAKTLKLSCSMVAKTIQWFNKTGSTQNRPRHGRPKKLSARAQRHIQRLCLGNRRMSAASIPAEVEGSIHFGRHFLFSLKVSAHWVWNFRMRFFVFVILKMCHAQKPCTLNPMRIN